MPADTKEPALNLTETERGVLLRTLNQKTPAIVEARMANALLLLADGLSAEDVSGLLFIDETTVTGWQTFITRTRHPR